MDSTDMPPPLPPASPPSGGGLPPAGPPPLITPPRSPAPRRGRGWMVFAIILMVVLALSVLINFTQFISGLGSYRVARGHSSGPRLDEATYEDNDAADKIALIDVSGVITDGAVDDAGYGLPDLIKAQLKRAKDDDHVKAVILRVNSPGGEVLAADEISRAISDFQKGENAKPVVAQMGDLAASGGYYISAPCRWIVANPMTLTGSIGVIMDSYNYRSLMDKVGVSPVVYKSGRFKDMLSGSRSTNEIPPEEHEMVQNLINEVYEKFKSVVQTGRDAAHEENKKATSSEDKGRALSPSWKDYADGRVLSGTQALQLGFVDELGDFEDSVKRAEKLGGIQTANLIFYEERRDLSDLFRFFGKSQTPTLKVDIGVDFPRIKGGQLYFLMPTVVN